MTSSPSPWFRGCRVVRHGIVATLLLGTLLAILPATAVSAATTFTVNTITDAPDTNPGDGICNSATSGPIRICSLRAALMETNTISFNAGNVTINVPAGTYTLTLTTGTTDDAFGDLNLTRVRSSNFIVGAGVGQTIVDGNGLPDVIGIAQEAELLISGATIRNGQSGITGFHGFVSLTDSRVTGMTSTSGSAISVSDVSLLRTTVESNAHAGLGIGAGTIQDSTIRNNGDWGMHANMGTSAAVNPVLSITGSTFNGNTLDGVVVDNFATHAAYGALTITNSTFSSNMRRGIWVSGPATIANVTVFGNNSGLELGDGSDVPSGTIRNSIIANNGTNCEVFSGYSSQGYNFVNGGSCTTNGLVGPNDIVGGDPGLGALANNGGPTQTLLPSATSPVIERIPLVGGCNNAHLTKDQRGSARPMGLKCDIGSVEIPPSTLPGTRPSGSPAGSAPAPLPTPQQPPAAPPGGAANPLPQPRP